MNNDILVCVLLGIAGVLFHSIIKLRGLLEDARVANVNFQPVRDYWLRDAPSILLSLLSVFVWVFLFGEIAKAYPKIEAFVRTSFFVMGAIGSYVLQLVLGRAKKQIRQVVDVKTDKADGKI